MKIYRFRVVSRILWLSFFTSGILTGTILLIYFHKKQSVILFLTIVISIFYSVKFLIKTKAYTDVEVYLTDLAIECNWARPFLFQSKENSYIEWSTIKSYTFEPQQRFDLFKIKTHSGQTIRLSHDKESNQRDDFKIFLRDFKQKVKGINKEQSNFTTIQKGKTIYETSFGIITAYIFLISLPYILYLSFTNENKNPGSLIFSISSGLYFVLQVYNHRKRKKSR